MTLAILREIQAWILLPRLSLAPYGLLPTHDLPLENSPTSEPKGIESHHSFVWSFVPFFIAKPLGRTSRSLPRPSSTSYVNGLRGVACFVVLHQHIGWQVARWIQHPYGADASHRHFLQLPILRLAHSGLFMVAVFFVLSGFVLAYSPLKKINTPSDPARDSSLLRSLSSSLLRRPLRLFVPMLAAMSVTSMAIYFYPAFDRGGWDSDHPSVIGMWWKMMKQAWPALNVYNWGYYWPLGFTHGWTLQMEYRGSIVVFLLCLLTCQMTAGLRKATLIFSAWYAMHWGRWEVFCFIEGMFIAELRIAPYQLPPLLGGLPTPPEGVRTSKRSRWQFLATIGWSIVLVFGLLVGGWPTYMAKEAQPWKALYAVTPASWTSYGTSEPDPTQTYWISIGAGLVLLSMEHLPTTQTIFNTVPLVYLGEISYAFYLLHQTIMFGIGSAWFNMLHSAGYSVTACFCTEYVLVVGILLCVADLFWRGVDEKVVNKTRDFAKWCM